MGEHVHLSTLEPYSEIHNLPVQQVQTSQFSLHISYFLQNCKKGKPSERSLPLLKNDIPNNLKPQKPVFYYGYSKGG